MARLVFASAAAPLLLLLALLALAWPAAAAIKYPTERLPRGNTTVIAIASNPYLLQAFALSTDGELVMKYKTDNTSFSDWITLANPPGGQWNSDPVVGVNTDGRVEVFIRFTTNLDVWQYVQADPRDPMSYGTPRESSCVDMAECKNSTLHPPDSYWNTQPLFPTSDMQIVNAPDGRLQIFYRGFDAQ